MLKSVLERFAASLVRVPHRIALNVGRFWKRWFRDGAQTSIRGSGEGQTRALKFCGDRNALGCHGGACFAVWRGAWERCFAFER